MIAAHAGPGESYRRAHLREGEYTLGLWLPLALADIIASLANMWKQEGDSPVSRLDVLATWPLPRTHAALARANAQADEEQMLTAFEALERRFGKAKEV